MPRANRAQAVLDVLRTAARWEPFLGPTGVTLYRLPGSRGETYTVSPVSCTCPADQYHGQGPPCKHRQALALALTAHQALSQPPTRRPTDDLFDGRRQPAGPGARTANRAPARDR